MSPTCVTFGPMSSRIGFDPIEGRVPAADHHAQLAGLERRHAARDGCVNHVGALRPDLLGHAAADGRAHRTAVDDNLAFAKTGQEPIGAFRHRFQGF